MKKIYKWKLNFNFFITTKHTRIILRASNLHTIIRLQVNWWYSKMNIGHRITKETNKIYQVRGIQLYIMISSLLSMIYPKSKRVEIVLSKI
jgi:hypothetical protein